MTDVREVCQCVRIGDLPEEILERVMSYLSPYNDCKKAALVCRKWHRLMLGVIKQREQAFCQAAKSGTLQWSQQEDASNSLFGRSMHSVCYIDGTMYMFGGTTCTQVVSGTCFCDLRKLDLGSRMWTRLMAAGEYPTPKAAASMVHHNGSLILFGGSAPPVPNPPHQPPHVYDELHIYDIANNRWRAVVSNTCPPPIASHRASMIGDLMVIFGGSCRPQTKYNDVWVLSLQSMTWSCMRIDGRKPPARDKHVQVVLDDGHILIIGGVGNFVKFLSDAWMLDISEVPWCWKEVNITGHPGSIAPQISSHAACKIGDSIVFFSKLRICPGLSPNSHRPPPAMQLSHRPCPPSKQSPRPQGGIERGSLRDLHRQPKRIRSQNMENGNCNSDSSYDIASDNVLPVNSDELVPSGCPCSPECMCRIPVPNSALVKRSHPKVGSNSVKPSRVPHGEQQYVLDVSAVISELQAAWLDIPDQNVNRNPINPSHVDERMRYGHAPAALFPSVCVGRAELIRFGGITKDVTPRLLNGQYFAY